MCITSRSDPVIDVELWPRRVEMLHLIVINWWNVNSAYCLRGSISAHRAVELNKGPLLPSGPSLVSLPPYSHTYMSSGVCMHVSLTCRWSEGSPSRPVPVDSWPCSLPDEAGSWRNLWTLFHISQPLEPPAADRLETRNEQKSFYFRFKNNFIIWIFRNSVHFFLEGLVAIQPTYVFVEYLISVYIFCSSLILLNYSGYK